jgi:hypothetical protein
MLYIHKLTLFVIQVCNSNKIISIDYDYSRQIINLAINKFYNELFKVGLYIKSIIKVIQF